MHLDIHRRFFTLENLLHRGQGPTWTQLLRKSRRAQALVEFAMMLPISIALFLGIVDLGRAFYQAMAIREAAQAGALYAMVWQNVTALCPTPCANTTTRN